MPFSPFQEKAKTQGQFESKKVAFMNTQEGTHRIRILEPDYKEVPTHYFPYHKTTVACLGEDCPVCANNKKLSMQISDWKELSKHPQYNRVTARFYINVLDKTPHKVCACGVEYFNYQGVFCPKCNEQLPEAKPLNKVKVLAKGKTLFQDMQAIEGAILDEQGNPIGLQNYDLNIIVRGTQRDTTYTVIADSGSIEPVNMEGLTLFPLENAIIRLTAEEMLEAQRGVSLKDIFTARKAKEPKLQPEEVQQVSEEVRSEVSAKVNSLFNQQS